MQYLFATCPIGFCDVGNFFSKINVAMPIEFENKYFFEVTVRMNISERFINSIRLSICLKCQN